MDRFAVDAISYDADFRTPTIDQMARHASVRVFDPGRPVPDDLVAVLVAAAQSASTSSNFQSWSVIQVVDRERKLAMSRFCNEQDFIDEAPLFLAFCADVCRVKWVTRRQGYRFGSDYLDLLLTAVIDTSLAGENAALAAESLGLGCCMIGAIRNRPREVSELLELPSGVFAVVGLTVGYPARRNAVRPRLPQSVVLHRERYSTAGFEEGIAEYDARMARTTIYQGRRVQVPGVTPDPAADTGPYSWAEHTARRMARGNEHRRGLGRYLVEKGFVLE